MAEPRKGRPVGSGRPLTAPTREQQELICQCIREGNYREVAAEWAGVAQRTFFRWLARGRREEDGVYRQLWQAVLEAERAAEMAMVALVTTAAKGDAKHAQWYLERKFPERWAANRIELRELKKRVEELEADAATRTTTPKPTGSDRDEADKPLTVEDVA